MATRGGGVKARSWSRWLVAAALCLLALHAVRAAFVAAEAERRPALARTLWSSHPAPLLTLAFADIGASARDGRAPPAEAIALIAAAGRAEPLAAEPLLVAGTARLADGEAADAERLLRAAARRDPRSTAAHFLLADLLVRQNRVPEALTHVAVLGRRLGPSTVGFADALAAYLRQPGAAARVAPVLARDPALRGQVLRRLAEDPATTPLLAAMIQPRDRKEAWLALAIDTRLAAGDVGGVRQLLTRAGLTGGTALSSWVGPAGPLNWRFPETKAGVAEAAGNGPLRLVFYGREDATLAEHVLLLPPGRYPLQTVAAGQVPLGTFEWRLTCAGRAQPAAVVPITTGTSRAELVVAADCPAQKLALWGRTGDFPRTVSADLASVALSRVGAGR